MVAAVEDLITENIDVWTSAIKRKSSAGRGGGKKVELYGVKKLRELILDLAVRGLLVPQNPDDEPATDLLKRIATEQADLAKAKSIKKPKKLDIISEAETPHSRPIGWVFARLNDLGDWGAGATPSRKSPELYGGDIPWFKSGELTGDYISTSEEFVTEIALKKSSLRYNKTGDVLLAMYGATIGKTSILTVPATTNQAVCACTPFSGFNNVYLLTLLKAYKQRFTGMGAGGAQPNISREKIIATVIGLPPEAEQHRIVAKVDELMTLCDQLELQTETSLAAHQTLVKTLLDALTQAATQSAENGNTDAGSPSPFEQAWHRLAEHFDTVFTTEDSIEQLKQTILQLAVMGKLVPQDPNDEPASDLLERIAAEKAQLVKGKKIQKQKALPDISDSEKPFELPLGWAWCRLATISQLITKGSSPKWQGIEYTDNPDDILFVTSENVGVEELLLEKRKYVEPKFNEIQPRSILCKNDLLMNIVGASIGRTAIFNTTDSANINQAVCLIRLFDDHNITEYLVKFFNSATCTNYMFDKQVDNARANLSMGNISKFVIPLPPINEQQRIVTKIDQLSTMCEQLKSHFKNAQTTQIQLADALTNQPTE